MASEVAGGFARRSRLIVSAIVPGAALLAVGLEGDAVAAVVRRIFAQLTPLHVVEAAVAALAAAEGVSLASGAVRVRVARWSRWRNKLTRVLDVPAGIALPAIVAVAAAFRVVLDRAETLPRVLGDELVYSDLAKGIALHGEPLLRGRLTTGYSLLYPLFLSLAYRVAATGATALEAAKIMNALAMALTAVPVYYLARRVVPHRWSLVVAALTVAAPWTAYTALPLTESLFYPAFMAFALVMVRTLEQPTWRRQLVLLLALAALVLIRPEGVAVAGSVVAAIVLDGHLRRSHRETLTRYATTLVSLALLLTTALAAAAAGLPVSTGAFHGLVGSLAHPLRLGKWAVWNVADYGLAIGVVSLAVFPLGLRRLLRRDAADSERAVGIVASTLALGILSSVVVLSASSYGLGILHERYLFYVTPLVLICLSRWLAEGLPRRRRAVLALGALAVLAVATLPAHVVIRSNDIDAPATSFLRGLSDEVAGVPLRVWTIGIATVAVGAFLLFERALVPLIAVAVAFVAVTAVNDYTGPLTPAQDQALSWVDRGLPRGASAALIHIGFPRYGTCGEAAEYEQQGLVVWTEFFNTHVDEVFHLGKEINRDNLASPELTNGPGGLVLEGKSPFAPRYAVIDSRQPIVGTRLARFDLAGLHSQFRLGASLTLWRVDPPLRFLAHAQPLPDRADGTSC